MLRSMLISLSSSHIIWSIFKINFVFESLCNIFKMQEKERNKHHTTTCVCRCMVCSVQYSVPVGLLCEWPIQCLCIGQHNFVGLFIMACKSYFPNFKQIRRWCYSKLQHHFLCSSNMVWSIFKIHFVFQSLTCTTFKRFSFTC